MAKSKNGIISSMAKFTPRQFKVITEQMYRRNLELAQLNKTLSLLRTIDLLVLQQHESLRSICDKMSAAIVNEYKECALAALYSNVASDGSDEVLLLGSAHTMLTSGGSGRQSIAEVLSQINPGHDLLDQGQNFYKLPKDGHKVARQLGLSVKELHEFSLELHIEAFYLAPLLASGGTVGVLVIGLHEADTESDQSLLDRVSEAVSLAMENKTLQEENRQILHKLRTSNARLKELDETKDDFVSMASHQLRTPLTSVKGYISMVLEEDAGKLTKLQRDMLGQAFFSSQRMVYLIADLLNVSRLKTGKFLIEPARVNLADMVQQELQQLEETAASRQLTLSYDRPTEFPDLMLDETKIRQVVMNFVDNAIYYTPAGGHITVQLIDKPASVELRVIDNGIGVSKSEQPHLFTKFYRAGNARKARPDGTGLGLFMAKKVIIGHGGATLVESQLGKGSTFGFILSKSKLGVPASRAKPTAERKHKHLVNT